MHTTTVGSARSSLISDIFVSTGVDWIVPTPATPKIWHDREVGTIYFHVNAQVFSVPSRWSANSSKDCSASASNLWKAS